MRFARSLVVAVAATMAVAGCHGSEPGVPDGSSGGPDAGAGKGVIVPWETTPAAFPGNVTDDGEITVSSVSLAIDTFEAIGDAGTGSNTRATLALAWGADGTTPDAAALPTAPPGLYSKLTIHVDGDLIADSYDITGTAKVNGTVFPYHIHDRDDLSISIYLDGPVEMRTLAAGSALTIPIAIDFARALRSIHYDDLDVDNGVLDLDTNDSQMSDFRDQFSDAFYTPH
jgi:hypothetical protein